MFRDTSGVIIIQVLKPQDIIFHFLDPPKVFLKFGSNIDMSNVVEGSDVYFDCDIDSNPEVYKVEWTKNVSDYITFLHYSRPNYHFRMFASVRT